MNASKALNSRIYEGRVFHQRYAPTAHRFSYSVFWLFIDLHELPALHKCLRLFSHNSANILSFHDKDFGDGPAVGLEDDARDRFLKAGIDLEGGRICLLCNARCFGYVFNPLSVYYGFDHTEKLVGLIYEVTNTFGDRHSYVIPVSRDQNHKHFKQDTSKEMHVSPFMQMQADYQFLLSEPGEKISVRIDQFQDQKRMLRACFSGHALEFTDTNLSKLLVKYPMMTGKVMGAIHWEAVKLWKKGLPFFKRPDAPRHGQTIIVKDSPYKQG